MIALAAALFCLSVVPPQPLLFHHQLLSGEVAILHHLSDAWRMVNDRRPVVLIAHDYYQAAQSLRRRGLHAFGMTITLSGGHLKGLLGELPVLIESVTVMVLMQTVNSLELRRVAEAVASQGCLLIEGANLPNGGVDILREFGFSRAEGLWHRHRIYRRDRMIAPLLLKARLRVGAAA